MKNLSLAGGKLIAALLASFILGAAGMVGFAYAIPSDEPTFTQEEVQRLNDIDAAFNNQSQ